MNESRCLQRLISCAGLCLWLAGAGDAAGRPRTQVAPAARVLVFVAHDCPISNAYAPEIERIYRAYKGRGVAFRLVYTEQLTETQAAAHSRAYRLDCAHLLDSTKHLARQYGVTVTPEACLLSPSGRLLYRGRIDDRYVEWGKQRVKPSRRDLRAALDAVLAKRPVAQPRTVAIGCFLE